MSQNEDPQEVLKKILNSDSKISKKNKNKKKTGNGIDEEESYRDGDVYSQDSFDSDAASDGSMNEKEKYDEMLKDRMKTYLNISEKINIAIDVNPILDGTSLKKRGKRGQAQLLKEQNQKLKELEHVKK